jgi:hypothetical protein
MLAPDHRRRFAAELISYLSLNRKTPNVLDEEKSVNLNILVAQQSDFSEMLLVVNSTRRLTSLATSSTRRTRKVFTKKLNDPSHGMTKVDFKESDIRLK